MNKPIFIVCAIMMMTGKILIDNSYIKEKDALKRCKELNKEYDFYDVYFVTKSKLNK